MGDILKLLLTTLVAWLTLFLLTRLRGEQQLSELTFFDYITGICIGSIAAELASELENPERPLIAMLAFGILTWLAALLSIKSPKIRRLLNGRTLILLNNGTLYRGSLRKAKMDLDDFLMMCREAGHFDLSQVQTVLLEHNGALSILPKSVNRPATPADFGQTPAQETVFLSLVCDGIISEPALKKCGKDRQWLKKQLQDQGFSSEKDVLLATYDGQNTVTVFAMNDQTCTGHGL